MQTRNSRYRVLAFDVETTGLLPKAGADLEDYPYIIQFSFAVYNVKTRIIEYTANYYINVECEIKPIITEITGITKEMCTQRGVALNRVLEEFYGYYNTCGIIIAHNLKFDSTVLQKEIERHAHESSVINAMKNTMFDQAYNLDRRKSTFCTMMYGINICNIMKERPRKNPDLPPTYFKKFPTLLEFHRHLFGTEPANLHNSMVDVLVCLRCFLKTCRQTHISEDEFEYMIHKYVV